MSEAINDNYVIEELTPEEVEALEEGKGDEPSCGVDASDSDLSSQQDEELPL